MAKHIVTIAPPTPNGGLHLGHLAGPYLAADVFKRTMELLGDECILVSYSDDYQDYVKRKAMETGQAAEKISSQFSNEIKQTLEAYNIALDNFLFSLDNTHFKKYVQVFYDGLSASQVHGEKDCKVPYFPKRNQYGYEAFARGVCPVCEADTDPSQCEHCATAPNMSDIQDIRSPIDDEQHEVRERTLEYIALKDCREFISKKYANAPLRPASREFINRFLNKEHDDWFINRPDGCGIPVTSKFGHKTPLSTWFSGIAGYAAASEELDGSGKHADHIEYFWKDKSTRISMFVGFDCSYSHAIIYPTLLSFQEEFTQNTHIYTNHFLELDGKDFSTSRGHAIWANELIGKHHIDCIRFYLASVSPEMARSNFILSDFHDFNNFFEKDIRNRLISDARAFDLALFESAQVMDIELCSSLVDEFIRTAHPNTFSMSDMAGVLLSYLKKFQRSTSSELNAGEKANCAILYAYLGMAIHPELSAEVFGAARTNFKALHDRIVSQKILSDQTHVDALVQDVA